MRSNLFTADIDWRQEIQKMFEEERRHVGIRPPTTRPNSKVESSVEKPLDMLKRAVVRALTKHVEGYTAEEILQMADGTATALRLQNQQLRELLSKMIDAGELIYVIEEVEWPEGSGWASKIRRLRLSPQAWVEAVCASGSSRAAV